MNNLRKYNAILVQKKKYKKLEISEPFREAFGELVQGFRMVVWGASGNGKSNFVMKMAAELLKIGKVAYLSLEEGAGMTMQNLIVRHIPPEQIRRLTIITPPVDVEQIIDWLAKPRTPPFVVVDSLQYLGIDYKQYKEMSWRLRGKSLIFVSHAKGAQPDGKTAEKLRYDADVKILVDRDIAFVKHSRFGGDKNFVIWEEGARKKRTKKQWAKCLSR